MHQEVNKEQRFIVIHTFNVLSFLTWKNCETPCILLLTQKKQTANILASSALLRLFFSSSFKKDDKYLDLREIFFAPLPSWLCWAGRGPGINVDSFSVDLC